MAEEAHDIVIISLFMSLLFLKNSKYFLPEPLLVLLSGTRLQLECLWRQSKQHHRVHGVGAAAEGKESVQGWAAVDTQELRDEQLHHPRSHARPLCHRVLIRTDNVGQAAEAVVPQCDELVGHHVICVQIPQLRTLRVSIPSSNTSPTIYGNRRWLNQGSRCLIVV